ncbi:MAG: GGDEF domain-containing protein [Chloroflexota bacterium]
MSATLAFYNLARLRVIALMLVLTQPLLLIADANFIEANADQVPPWAIWGAIGFRLGLAAVSAFLMFTSAHIHTPAAVTRGHRRWQLGYMLFCLFMAAMWAGIRLPISITVYLLAIFAAAAFLQFGARTSALVYGSSWTVLALALLSTSPNLTLAMPHLVNGTFLTLLAYGVSRVTYANEVRAYLNKQLIEQQRAALEAANRQLAESNAMLERLSFIDPLTNVPNRRYLDEYLQQESRRGARAQRPLAVLMIDVDYFKQFNDTYGHQAGDECLIRIATAIRVTLNRPADLLARFGGDEFVAILPDTDREGAEYLGQSIQRAVRECSPEHAGAPSGGVTVSVGVASRLPARGENGQLLLGAADAALYNAKAEGRDRCVAAD